MKVAGEIEFTITAQSTERVEAEMPVRAGVLNPFGVTHAGAMLWFADVCATVLAAGTAQFAPGGAGFPLGVALQANFVGNQRDGVLRATSVFVKRGKLLSVVRTTITGEGGRLIADVTTSHVPARGEPAPGAPGR
jgi:1,4-dihydroxy-2-naphthoyl-CoA hydrolase